MCLSFCREIAPVLLRREATVGVEVKGGSGSGCSGLSYQMYHGLGLWLGLDVIKVHMSLVA